MNKKIETVSVKDAAKLLNVSPQFVRAGLRSGALPFGTAVKMSSQYTYHIPKARLLEYIGGDWV